MIERDDGADEAGRFGAAQWLSRTTRRLPPLPVVGWGLLLVGVVLFAVGVALPFIPLALFGALLALPGAALLTLGYGRGALGVDT